MEMSYRWGLTNGKEDLETNAFAQVRLLNVPNKTAIEPVETFDAKWRVCNPESAKDFSACGYFFGAALHREMPPGHAAIQVVLILHSEVDARARALASAVDGLDIDISHRCGSGRAVRDWTFHVYEDGERLAGYLEYDTDLFTAASAQSTTDRFLQSLRLLATAADADLSQTIAAAEPDRTRP